MTDAPQLLTEAEWPTFTRMDSDAQYSFLRARNLIREEPVDPDLEEAREIAALQWSHNAENYRSGKNDTFSEVVALLAALKRGKELGPKLTLTLGMVREAVSHNVLLVNRTALQSLEIDYDAIHRALTEQLAGVGDA